MFSFGENTLGYLSRLNLKQIHNLVRPAVKHIEPGISLNPTFSNQDFWLKLDNAAKIYPAVQSAELTSVFRLTAVLKAPVRVTPFLRVVKSITRRFPYYKMKLHKGFFWYYLQYTDEKLEASPDAGVPCRSFEKHDLLFRILVRGQAISVEFSHILADGAAAFEFLKTLLMAYFEACGLSIGRHETAYHSISDEPVPEEYEDAFSKYVQINLPSPLKIPRAFHLPFALRSMPRFRVMSFLIRLPELSAQAKKHNTTITVYLVAVYLFALQRLYNKLPSGRRGARKILRIQVPVNLRRIYPSKTMRNFSLFVRPEIDLRLGQYSFEEIVKTVHHHMALETDKKLINKIISRNVGAERNLLLRNTPLFIKSLILNFTYHIAGTSRYSGVITNLGRASLGPSADGLIDHFRFIAPPPNKALKVNCGVIGFGDTLVLSFGNITQSTALEMEYVSILTAERMHIRYLAHL